MSNKSKRGGYGRSRHLSVSRVDFASNGRMNEEMNHRSMEVRICAGVLKGV